MSDNNLIHEDKDNIRVDINYAGELLVSSTVPWSIDYHAESVEDTVSRVSDNIIHLALTKIDRRFPELFKRLTDLMEDPVSADMLSFHVVIMRNMWGTRYNNIYGPVDVGID